MTYQIDVLSAQKCSCLTRYVRARIVAVKSDPSSAVSFPDFLEDNWQTNGWVPLRIDYCSRCTIATCPLFPKKQAIICLEVQLLLDLAHLETPIQLTVKFYDRAVSLQIATLGLPNPEI